MTKIIHIKQRFKYKLDNEKISNNNRYTEFFINILMSQKSTN